MSDSGRIYEIVAPSGDVLTHYWAINEEDAIRQHHRCYCAPFWPPSYTQEQYWQKMTNDGFSIREKAGT